MRIYKHDLSHIGKDLHKTYVCYAKFIFLSDQIQPSIFYSLWKCMEMIDRYKQKIQNELMCLQFLMFLYNSDP